ncbi:MAG TPA: acyl-CoA dehydrogenase family protein, partial [Myxococcaceae bacterium]|nr:acyl-CoA dehydrogenase family protein [Myxococcaceae bacterium]
MNLTLSDVQQSIRELARSFARDRIAPHARAHDREERIAPELLKDLASLGLMGINIAPELGGAGAGAVAYALAMMEISAACASTSVVMAVTNMCGELISRFGTEAQKAKYVPRLVSGEAIAGAFALSEPHCGSDAA